MDGLRAYLSALNIRNKCKHPLFLVLRFDTCVSWIRSGAFASVGITAVKLAPEAADASYLAAGASCPAEIATVI